MDKLRDIKSVCQSANAPNIRRLKLIDVSQVVKINYPNLYNNPAVLNYELGQTSVVIKPGTRLINIGFISGFGSFDSTAEFTDEGVAYTERVTVSIKKDKAENTLAIAKMLNKGFIGFIQDRNGRCKVLGTIKQPLRLTVSSFSVSPNEKTLTWQCKTRFQSYFIPSIKDEDIANGEFSNDFSEDFNI
ncbi:MAG: hypothetical protein MUF12_00615 [Sediminibacterium sp.]|nr:hypothetical protein [Sediminibacterium sp.]